MLIVFLPICQCREAVGKLSTCREAVVSNQNRNVPFLTSLEMSPFSISGLLRLASFFRRILFSVGLARSTALRSPQGGAFNRLVEALISFFARVCYIS
jgi:hypothetical protein